MSNKFRRAATVLAIAGAGLAFAPAFADTSAGSSHADHDDHDDQDEDRTLETVIVKSTRSGRAVNDQPMRVEVINAEEILEKATMRPGNISTLVAETGGVRVQTTSPALGSANIRLQGLYGRYTQLLSDGLPLYGGQAASIGLLQIPPTDLSQVEVIKGAASSMYGGSALGGVINLISRRPGDETGGELLFNQTSEDGQDLTAYLETPLTSSVGVSLTLGAHRQAEQDFDSDGWIDLPGNERWTARPRLVWEGANGASVYATLGFMTEQRSGGTLPGRTVPDGTEFPQDQDSTRLDGGFIADTPLTETLTLNVRGSAMQQDHEHRFGASIEEDRHESVLIETSIAADGDRTDWVVGAAFQSETYESDMYPGFDYTHDVPGLFGQLDHDLSETVSLSVSGRLDDHSTYGTQFSPRVSALYRPGDWTIRASYGQGFFAPTPFVEEIEAAGLSRLDPLGQLAEETAETASLDVGYRKGAVEANASLFGSNVSGVTELEAYASLPGGPQDRVRLVNAPGDTRIRGAELLLRYYWNDLKLTGNYLYLDATETDGAGGRRELELTPRHSAGFVAMWEQHGRGRLGFEAYYTGPQRLGGNPYLDESKSYWHLGLLGEITTGPASWFVNAENLLDVRQTKEHPLVLPSRAPDGQWTTDIWSRNDGLILNGGVRLKF
ncbi:MAG: TonB-dependent receptor [Pseudomonadota bacterium]|nr:TonB-dependent receptor [Pseudomonadota bacterium]